jgi:hypothetical protein
LVRIFSSYKACPFSLDFIQVREHDKQIYYCFRSVYNVLYVIIFINMSVRLGVL